MAYKDDVWVFGRGRNHEEHARDRRLERIEGRPFDTLSTVEVGMLGEEVACRDLELRGYEICDRNWRSPFGEADIIALDGSLVLLVEVKTRIYDGIGERPMPETAVSISKRERYARIASYFMTIHPDVTSVRFDVVSVILSEGEEPEVHYVADAFSWDE